MLSQILKLISFLFNLFWLLFGSVPASWIFCPQRQYRGDRQLFWQEEERLYDQAASTCEDLWSCYNWDQCDSFDFSMIIVIFMIGMIIQDCDYFHNWGDLHDWLFSFEMILKMLHLSSWDQMRMNASTPMCSLPSASVACSSLINTIDHNDRFDWESESAAAWSTLLVRSVKVQKPDRHCWS